MLARRSGSFRHFICVAEPERRRSRTGLGANLIVRMSKIPTTAEVSHARALCDIEVFETIEAFCGDSTRRGGLCRNAVRVLFVKA
jgi:hypothetical protein